MRVPVEEVRATVVSIIENACAQLDRAYTLFDLDVENNAERSSANEAKETSLAERERTVGNRERALDQIREVAANRKAEIEVLKQRLAEHSETIHELNAQIRALNTKLADYERVLAPLMGGVK